MPRDRRHRPLGYSDSVCGEPWPLRPHSRVQHGNICMQKDDVPLDIFWTCFSPGKSVWLYTHMNQLWWLHSYSQGACSWTLGPLCQVISLKYHSNWFTGLLHNAVSVWYSLCPLYRMCTSAQTQARTHACNVLQGNSPKPRLQRKTYSCCTAKLGGVWILTFNRCLSCFSWKLSALYRGSTGEL